MPRRLPTAVTREAKRRARLLLVHARGPVLDLGGPVSPIASGDWGSARAAGSTTLEHRGDPTAALGAVAEGAGAGRYADVLSVMVSPYVADLALWLTRIAAVLDREGRLLFVEPDAAARSWASVAAPAFRSLSGLELGRDITGSMWNSGLSVTQIERRPVPRAGWPLRNMVSGVARLRLEADHLPRRK